MISDPRDDGDILFANSRLIRRVLASINVQEPEISAMEEVYRTSILSRIKPGTTVYYVRALPATLPEHCGETLKLVPPEDQQ